MYPPPPEKIACQVHTITDCPFKAVIRVPLNSLGPRTAHLDETLARQARLDKTSARQACP